MVNPIVIITFLKLGRAIIALVVIKGMIKYSEKRHFIEKYTSFGLK